MRHGVGASRFVCLQLLHPESSLSKLLADSFRIYQSIITIIAMTKVIVERNLIYTVSVAGRMVSRPLAETVPVATLSKLLITCCILTKGVEQGVVSVALY